MEPRKYTREYWNELKQSKEYRDYIVPLRRKKHNARKLVAYYVRTGRIDKEPCEYADCTETKVEAHHADYNMPLDVIWLCRAHHMELHKHIEINDGN